MDKQKITEFFKEIDEIIINNHKKEALESIKELLNSYNSGTEKNILKEWVKILEKIDNEEFKEIQENLNKQKTNSKNTTSKKEIEILQNLITSIEKFSELNDMFRNFFMVDVVDDIRLEDVQKIIYRLYGKDYKYLVITVESGEVFSYNLTNDFFESLFCEGNSF